MLFFFRFFMFGPSEREVCYNSLKTWQWSHKSLPSSDPIKPRVRCFVTHPFARLDPEAWGCKLYVVEESRRKHPPQSGSLRDFYHLQPPLSGQALWEPTWSAAAFLWCLSGLEAIKLEASAGILEVLGLWVFFVGFFFLHCAIWTAVAMFAIVLFWRLLMCVCVFSWIGKCYCSANTKLQPLLCCIIHMSCSSL